MSIPQKDFILNEILKSGLSLENFVSSCFDKNWSLYENYSYLDKDENKSRELDLFVSTEPNFAEPYEIVANIFIQCKKIPGNVWVFPKSHSKIYTSFMTVTPHSSIDLTIFDINKTSIDSIEPKVTNYKEIIVNKDLSNKLTSNIFESMITLIKAASYEREKVLKDQELFQEELKTDPEMKEGFLENPSGIFNLFYLVTVFEGKMYLIDFDSKSKLKEIQIALISTRHESINYQGDFLIFVMNRKYFKKFLKIIESDLTIFRKRIKKNKIEINKNILEAYRL